MTIMTCLLLPFIPTGQFLFDDNHCVTQDLASDCRQRGGDRVDPGFTIRA